MEIFIVDAGEANFTLGNQSMRIEGGHMVIVLKDTPHKFVSTTTTELRLIAIHCNNETISERLE
jgi:mannose-6-phosphate isomerase-like protein (cupin superfamily)